MNELIAKLGLIKEMKMNKNKLVLVGLLMAMLTGCASLNDTTVRSYADNGYKLSKDGSGVVYGTYKQTNKWFIP